MSGPKSSFYDITAIQKQILAEKRREEERRRHEELARQVRIKNSDAAIDKAFAVLQNFDAQKKDFDDEKFLNQLNLFANDSRLSADLLNKIEQTKNIFESICDSTYKKILPR